MTQSEIRTQIEADPFRKATLDAAARNEASDDPVMQMQGALVKEVAIPFLDWSTKEAVLNRTLPIEVIKAVTKLFAGCLATIATDATRTDEQYDELIRFLADVFSLELVDAAQTVKADTNRSIN